MFFRKKQKRYDLFELSKSDAIYLDQPNSRCLEDSLMGTTKESKFDFCVREHLQGQMNCTLPWTIASNETDIGLNLCETPAQYDHFLSIFNWLQTSNEGEIATATGCLPPCRRSEFSTEEIASTISDIGFWGKGKQQPSEIEMYFASGRFQVRKQYLTYDSHNLVADIGGYLGLLLGHSVFGVVQAAEALWDAKGKACEFLFGWSDKAVKSK